MTAPAKQPQPPIPSGAGDREDRRRLREQAREQLIRRALELSEGAPFRELSVDRIATAAGISRSAFYNHFRDKNDLLLAALGDAASELESTADRCWQSEGAPADRVRRALEAVVSIYTEHAGLLRVGFEVSTYDEEIREAWTGIVGRFVDATAKHIRSEQRAGLIPAGHEPEPTAEALVWMSERLAYVHIARGDRGPEELVAAMLPIWTAALYPGVITAEELRPRWPGSELWGESQAG